MLYHFERASTVVGAFFMRAYHFVKASVFPKLLDAKKNPAGAEAAAGFIRFKPFDKPFIAREVI